MRRDAVSHGCRGGAGLDPREAQSIYLGRLVRGGGSSSWTTTNSPAWPEPHPSASLPVTTVAPAALASTFLTSLTGACVFAALDLTGRGNIAPDWPVGLLCGLGGLADGYLGAMLQPLVPEGRLRQLLGTCAAGICGDGFVGARDDQLHWRDAGEDVMGGAIQAGGLTTLARATSAVGRAGGSKKLIGACYAGLACSGGSCPAPALSS